MFIAGEARLSAELSRKQSNFFSIGYDERPEGCSSVTRKRTFHFRFLRLIARIKKVQDPFMKSLLAILSILLIPVLCASAATEQEKPFVEKYKTALETKDTTTLQSCLYTNGADPMIVGFYKMMQSNGEGDKVSKIDLVDLTPDDVKKATAPQDGPSGKVCLNLKPT